MYISYTEVTEHSARQDRLNRWRGGGKVKDGISLCL
jgi:hypothetical protein